MILSLQEVAEHGGGGADEIRKIGKFGAGAEGIEHGMIMPQRGMMS